MTISTMKNKRISFVFIIFTFIIFLCLRFFVLTDGVATFSSCLFVALVGFTLGIIYTLVDIWQINRLEKSIIANFSYLENYKCNVFKETDASFIAQIKKGKCTVYLSQKGLYLADYYYDIQRYVTKLQSRCERLNIIDLLIIYLYKYRMHLLVFSMSFLQFWICFHILTTINTMDVISLVALPILFALITFKIDDLCDFYFKRIMFKRELGYFIVRND